MCADAKYNSPFVHFSVTFPNKQLSEGTPAGCADANYHNSAELKVCVCGRVTERCPHFRPTPMSLPRGAGTPME